MAGQGQDQFPPFHGPSNAGEVKTRNVKSDSDGGVGVLELFWFRDFVPSRHAPSRVRPGQPGSGRVIGRNFISNLSICFVSAPDRDGKGRFFRAPHRAELHKSKTLAGRTRSNRAELKWNLFGALPDYKVFVL